MDAVDRFDGERYLRRLGERILLSRENSPFGGPLAQQARALVAVGAVDTATAQRVVDDYARAGAIRSISGPARRSPTAVGGPLEKRRIVPCGRTIEQPWGELVVRYISLGATDTRLEVTLLARNTDPPSGRRRQHGHGPFNSGLTRGHPPSLTVTDDRGTAGMGGFSGGGTDEEWTGRYDLHPPLAADTAWIELFGERLELDAVSEDKTVTVETFDESDAIERYLDQCLASNGHGPHIASVDATLEALNETGLLQADDSLALETVAIRDALQGNGGSVGITREPWRSLLASRGRTGGHRGTLLVGAVTPVFGRISAALLQLESSEDGFHCDFEISGSLALGMHNAADLAADLVTFAAADDRGNHYLGQTNNWGGGEGLTSGTLDFWPALDPHAEQLDLILTTSQARATIAIPLIWTAP